jgi:hypothetical protein
LFQDTSSVGRLQSSVKSQLVECKYYIKVYASYDACVCCFRPSIEFPVMIYIPDVIKNIQIYRPQVWEPKVMPAYKIVLPTSTELGLNNGVSTNVQFSSNYDSMNFNA